LHLALAAVLLRPQSASMRTLIQFEVDDQTVKLRI